MQNENRTVIVQRAIVQLWLMAIEGLHERTEYIDIFLSFCPSLNCVLFLMFCLLVEGECQILVFLRVIFSVS